MLSTSRWTRCCVRSDRGLGHRVSRGSARSCAGVSRRVRGRDTDPLDPEHLCLPDSTNPDVWSIPAAAFQRPRGVRSFTPCFGLAHDQVVVTTLGSQVGSGLQLEAFKNRGPGLRRSPCSRWAHISHSPFQNGEEARHVQACVYVRKAFRFCARLR